MPSVRTNFRLRLGHMLCGVSAVAIVATLTVSPARADALKWDGSNGSWFDVMRWIWDGHVPVAGDLVHHDGGLIEIDAGQNAAAGTIFIGIGDGTLPIAPTASISVDGTLTTQDTWLGYNLDGSGIVTLNSGSSWTNTGGMVVGEVGQGVINVSGGALNTAGVQLGGGAPDNMGTGTINLNASASHWTATGRVSVGNYGEGHVVIENGASAEATGLLVGHHAGSTGTVTIDGTDSEWVHSGVVYIGNEGQGTLTVSDGGLLSGTDGYVATENGSAGSTALITGAGSTWTNSGDFFVGHNTDASGEVTIANGGKVTAGQHIILGDLADSFGKLTVTGTNSTSTNDGDFNIGRFGDGELVVDDGGLVEVHIGNVYFGNEANSFGKGLITGATSWLHADNKVFIGTDGDGELRLAAGGKVTATQVRIAYGAGTSGTLILGGAEGTAAVAAGIVDTPAIAFGAGNGRILVNATGTTNLSAVISGAGKIDIDAGHLLLDGNNSYSGGTTVNSGQLTLDHSNAAGTGAITLANGTTLSYANGISVDNHLSVLGSVDLEVATGTATQTGDVTVAAGATYNLIGAGILNFASDTVTVNGTLTGPLSIGNGTRLKGSGTVGTTTVNANGIVAPGNSIGTLNIAGDITFNAASIYEVEIDDAGGSDLIDATGTAFINGGTVKVQPYAGSYDPTTSYTILTAAAIGGLGQFDGVTSDLAFLTPTLSYDATSVKLLMTRNNVAFGGVGATPNQRAAGDGIASLTAGNAIYDALIGLSTSDAQALLEALAGDLHPSLAGVLINGSSTITDTTTDRVTAALDADGAEQGASAYLPTTALPTSPIADRGIWGEFYGQLGLIESDGNAAGLDTAAAGLSIGADAMVGDWVAGMLVHAGTTNAETETGGTADTTDYGIGIYGGRRWGATQLSLGAGYTRHAIETSRTVKAGGLSNTLTADYDAGTAQVFGELSHEFDFGAASITPFAGLAYIQHDSDGYSETGGPAALSSSGTSLGAAFTHMGLRAEHAFILGEDTLVTAHAALGWRHGFADAPSVTQTIGGGPAFAIAGAPIPADALTLAAGVNLALAAGTSLNIGYDGQIGSGTQAHAITAGLRSSF